MVGKIRHLQNVGGRYFARNSIPKDLRATLGKTELLTPLGADRRSALIALPSAVAKHLDNLADARRHISSKGAPPLHPMTWDEIAQTHYAEELQHDINARYFEMPASLPIETLNVGDFGMTLEDIKKSGEDSRRFSIKVRTDVLKRILSGEAKREEAMASVGWAIDQFRARGNIEVEKNSLEERKLAAVIAHVELEALARGKERDQGHFTGTPSFDVLSQPVKPVGPKKTVSLKGLFAKHIAELEAFGRGKGAARRWKPVFKNFATFLKHEDAAIITRRDVLNWKDELLKTFAPKSVRDVHLAALKAVLQCGLNNDELKSNVAKDIKFPFPLRTALRERGPTNDEAVAILKAVSDYTPRNSQTPQTRESPQITAAKKWCPWLAAFTGARIAELTQLRKEDIYHIDDVHYLRITPEAGSVKNNRYRDVPIHAQLIDRGFLEFVSQSGNGPLFFKIDNKRKDAAEHPSKHVAKRVSTWIRGLNILPTEVSPSHGWRHRFKTIGRELRIETIILDAMQGHSERSASDNYGSTTLKTKKEALEKFPYYEVA